MRPLFFFILVYAAIRDRRLERELDDRVWAALVAKGYANPDGTTNDAATDPYFFPLDWSEVDAEPHPASMAD